MVAAVSITRRAKPAAQLAMRPAVKRGAKRTARPGAPEARALMLTLTLALGLGVLSAPRPARAAMNFCAAPALQSSERTRADAGVKALLQEAAAHVNDAPHPLAHLHADAQSAAAAQDLPLMRDAALAWRVSGDQRYLKLVDRFLAAWVTTYQPSFNPIDESRFDSLIIAYDLTASALPVKTRNATTTFLRKLAGGYIARIDAQARPLTGDFRNNWQSRRIELIAMAAFSVDDRKLINAAQRLFVEQIGNNIGPDGTTIDFTERNALHYVTEDLQPLAMAALAARRHNRNWLRQRAPNGASLEAALDWLAPYALGRRTHAEAAPIPMPASSAPASASLPGFSGPWDPRDATDLYHLAARLDARYRPVAAHLSSNPPAWLTVCLPAPM